MAQINQLGNIEQFRVVDGFPNYLISNCGRVMNARTGKMLKPTLAGEGYRQVEVTANGNSKRFFIHRLVALTFVDNPNNLPCVDHIDHDKANNTISNLRWVTQSENMRNVRKRKNTTSKFRGVSLVKKSGKWRAMINIDGRNRYLGAFAHEEEAARAYDQCARENGYHTAVLNFPQ